MIKDFVIIDEQWRNGVALEEYGGKFSLVRAYQDRDDGVRLKWGYGQKDKAPMEKAIPWKVELGDRDTAVSVLNRFLIELDAPNDPVNASVDDPNLEIPF